MGKVPFLSLSPIFFSHQGPALYQFFFWEFFMRNLRVPTGCLFLQYRYRGVRKTHCCIFGALPESKFDFRPFLLPLAAQLSPGASPTWRVTTNNKWKGGRYDGACLELSRYDRKKTMPFKVRIKLWLSIFFLGVWTMELRCVLEVTFQGRCLGFPNLS